jgi:methyl-accepting chemotaxis protein
MRLRWLHHCTIQAKLVLGFGLVGLIMAGVSWLGMGSLERISGSIGGILLSLGIGYGITRPINRTLQQITATIEQASAGNFSARVTPTADNELDRMGRAINRMLAHFGNNLRQVSATARQVGRVSRQLAAGHEQLPASLQEQAASLEETATSVRHMTSIARRCVNDVRTVNRIVATVKERVERGEPGARQAVETMQDVTAIARRVAEHLTIIDEIATLADLLTNGVTVEVTRPEKEDPGFIVIVEEVRALAQRSVSISKEIRTLMTDAVAKVNHSAALVNKSRDASTEVAAAIEKVANLIVTIGEASEKQTQNIDRASRIVTRMGGLTKQNVAQAKKLRLATRVLVARAENLDAWAAQCRSARDGVIGSQRSDISSQATRNVVPRNGGAQDKGEGREAAAAISGSEAAHGMSDESQTQSLRITQHWLALDLRVGGRTN